MSGEKANDNSKDRLRVEARLVQRFFKAFERKTDQLELRRDFRLSEREQKVLMDLVTANLLQGVAAGIVTFVALRRLRAAYYKRLQGSLQKPPSVPNAFNSPFQQQNPPVQKIATAMEGVQDQSTFRFSRFIFNQFTILLDGMLSFYVTVYVSTRQSDMFLQKVTDIPLLEGQSTVADELCPVFLNELKILHREQRNHRLSGVEEMALKDPETPALKCLLDFCTNCQRRAAYEDLLRRDRGLPPNEPISIPPPGVPLDVAFTELSMSDDDTKGAGWDSSDTDEFGTGSLNEDIDSMNLTDWAEDFVADQEEDDPKKRRSSR
jgi:DNA-binding protein Fis